MKNHQKCRKIIRNVEKRRKNQQKYQKIIRNVEKLEKTNKNILKS